jgi:hypothetical protein
MKPRGKPLRRTGFTNRGKPLRRYVGLDRSSKSRAGSGTTGEGGSVVSSAGRPRVARGQPAVPAETATKLRKRSQGWCEIQLEGCYGRAVHPHHRITTKSGGRHGAAKVEHDQLSDLLHLCWHCHDVVTREPKWAKRWVNGWSLDENDNPSMRPVLYRGQLMYLDDAGDTHDFEEVGA